MEVLSEPLVTMDADMLFLGIEFEEVTALPLANRQMRCLLLCLWGVEMRVKYKTAARWQACRPRHRAAKQRPPWRVISRV